MNDNYDCHPDAFRSEQLVGLICSILAGETPEAQGAALAHLLARYIASHPPPLRDSTVISLMECVSGLVPLCVDELIAEGQVSADWREWTKH